MTRPLREVAEAARRLGGGDLGARARGGSDAESAELAVAFNGMADRLERSEELRRRAASDLAHDLATPATVLESQLQAMVDGVVPADAAADRARAGRGGRPVGRDRAARRADAGRGGAASALAGTRRHGRSRARDRGVPGRPPSRPRRDRVRRGGRRRRERPRRSRPADAGAPQPGDQRHPALATRRQRSHRGRHGFGRRDPHHRRGCRASPTRTCPTSSSASIGPIGRGGERRAAGSG